MRRGYLQAARGSNVWLPGECPPMKQGRPETGGSTSVPNLDRFMLDGEPFVGSQYELLAHLRTNQAPCNVIGSDRYNRTFVELLK